MGKEVSMFGRTEIEKDKFYRYKSLIFLEDVNINNMLLSNKISSGGKTINTFLVTCMMVIKKIYIYWNKVSTNIKKELDSKRAYNKKFLKTKIKSYVDEAADFYNKVIPDF